MEVIESRESAAADPTVANGASGLYLDNSLLDDGRSSSLSEIDDVSDDEPSDYEFIKPEKPVPELPDNDSEAETERIDDSPHNIRLRNDIVVSAGYEPSPSKLAQSTTCNDVDQDDDQLMDDSPSKSRQLSIKAARNGALAEDDDVEYSHKQEDSALPDPFGNKKRKRLVLGENVEASIEEDGPLKKRRSSTKSDLSDPAPDDTPLSPEPPDELSTAIDDETPADDTQDNDVRVAAKTKKFAKSKRKNKKARNDTDDDIETGGAATGTEGGVDDQLDDDEQAEREEAEDGDATAKQEEECMCPWAFASLLASRS